MKRKNILFLVFFVLLLSGCEDRPILSSYSLVLPELPGHWEEVLGEPLWRIEWVNEVGVWQRREGVAGTNSGTGGLELSLINEWIYPVIAWPYWPDLDLHPALMRPAGGIFPRDVSGGNLVLTWEGGVDAVFWKELGAAAETGSQRLPWNFDWPRFREILVTGNISDEVKEDPWLPDWRDIAARTVRSGFDSRRIVPERSNELVISELTDIGGLWISSSPFRPPINAPPEGPLELKVYESTETWVSSKGILKGSTRGWIFIAR
ncbi:MAG: hypothetical protein FWG77_09150 [Treponema sp.]|nr:hypothetical protein [Treponema sp.]